MDGRYSSKPFIRLTNRARPRGASLDLEDARKFGRRLIEAVHCARTQPVVPKARAFQLM
jgi:hypothetical protein